MRHNDKANLDNDLISSFTFYELGKRLLKHQVGFTFAVARHSYRSRNRRSKQAVPVLAPVKAVAKREGYQLD